MTADDETTTEANAGDDGPSGPRRVRRSTGRRREQQAALRRERRRDRVVRVFGLVAVIGVLGVVAVALGPQLVDGVSGLLDGSGDPVAEATPTSSATDLSSDEPVAVRRTVLVATLDESDGETVDAIQLLTADPATGGAAIVFLPPSTITEVPGYGLIAIGQAVALGGAPLLELTLENTLSIGVDASLEMTRSSWAALFARTGGAEVTVREPIDVAAADGTAERRFEPGPQFLDGPRLAELLTVDVPGTTELATFPRAQVVLEGFLDSAQGQLDAVFDDGAPMLQSTSPAVVEEVLRALVAADQEDRLDVLTLPVEPVGSGDDLVYVVDDDRGPTFAADVLGAGTTARGDVVAGVRLEVLNGNGQVGIGADVAQQLVPLGHTVVITGNAESFDQPTTLITVRGDDPALVEAAQEIVDTLGVGRIQVSGIPSTTVDISIVVGVDYAG